MPQVPKDGLDQNMLCSGIPHPVHLQHLPFDGHGRVKAKRQSLCFIELEDHKRPGNRRRSDILRHCHSMRPQAARR